MRMTIKRKSSKTAVASIKEKEEEPVKVTPVNGTPDENTKSEETEEVKEEIPKEEVQNSQPANVSAQNSYIIQQEILLQKSV